ncbi:hypothetical protein PAXRUDRAFT_827142 [Paxillus rubicundulus Ve08.2h10]|uniref:Uncharacterized protein n=1 Tax=Paxillus rubicundulus Ve08.2h10 TaxID=930991 RepID=A0A0D0E8Y9_9AGAM|nr:hypothetical protein PAXRUDRAFT_827142 [Paxillus rubicundulus Ve08.2h10]
MTLQTQDNAKIRGLCRLFAPRVEFFPTTGISGAPSPGIDLIIRPDGGTRRR